MRRDTGNLFARKSDEAGEAVAREDDDNMVDDLLDDSAWGLDVWVQGVNPIVE